MKRLPVGEQSFEKLRINNSVYIDKTVFIHRLINTGGGYYFLSRPRRFGKSLLLTTIQAFFEGKKELFEDLYIYDKTDWQPHPVILLDMSGFNTSSMDELKIGMITMLEIIANRQNLSIDVKEPTAYFSKLIEMAYQKSGKRVVLLVDEYDKPILDKIENLPLANEIRSLLQSFYTVIKASSASLQFVMLTGVSKISQTSIFSGLNNLSDITLNERYAGICGYTQQELENSFDANILVLAERYKMDKPDMYQKIKKWYNGYSWDGETFVYNPFSVLKLLDENDFDSYWFASGTPTFLIKLIKKLDDFSPVLADKIIVAKGFENKQSLESMQIIPLSFQTGYLTIKKRFFLEGEYELQIPNEEVRVALLESLVTSMVQLPEREMRLLGKKLYTAFENGDVALACQYLTTIYSNAAYHEGTSTEGYYHNLFEIIAKFAGIDIQTEVRTDFGRTDSVLKLPTKTFVVEIKYAADKQGLPAALQQGMAQIKEKKYYQPYLHQGKPVHLLALAFAKGEVGFLEEVVEE